MTNQPKPEREPLEVTHPHLKEFFGFLPELNKEGDRGQVLISCSYLDELLRQTLLAFFIEDGNSNRLVEGFNAPLGTFSTRISAAFALGLISEREFRECNTLRRIRNRFGHHVQASFDMQEIRDLCQNLTFAAQDYGTVTVDARSRYTTAAVGLIVGLTYRPHYVSKNRREFRDWHLEPPLQGCPASLVGFFHGAFQPHLDGPAGLSEAEPDLRRADAVPVPENHC